MNEKIERLESLVSANRCFIGISFFLNVVWLGLVLFLYNRNFDSDAESTSVAISLTMIEIVLAVLAIVLGLGAFFGFWMIREAAISAARKEARQYVDENAPRIFGEMRRSGEDSQEPAINVADESDVIAQSTRETDNGEPNGS